jgi:hypothetical protein
VLLCTLFTGLSGEQVRTTPRDSSFSSEWAGLPGRVWT